MSAACKLTPKSQKWFDENAYKDVVGDYWSSEEKYNEWSKRKNIGESSEFCISVADINTNNFYTDKPWRFAWGIEETPDTHPQYYI
jgi:hypothetical protein